MAFISVCTNAALARRPSAEAGGGTELSIGSNLVWTLVGNGTYAASQWVVIVGLARVGSPALLGQFALVHAIVLPVIVLANLQLRTAMASDATGRFQFVDYVGLRVLMLAAAAMFLGVVSFFYRNDPSTFFALLATGLYRSIESVNDVFCGLQQQSQRMDRVAISAMSRGTLAATAILSLAVLGQPLAVGILAMAAMAALVLVIYDLPQACKQFGIRRQGELRPRLDRETLTLLARIVAPMGVVALASALFANLPRYWISHYVGRYELGIFAAFMSALAGLHLLQTSLGQAMLARLAKCYALRQQRRYLRLALAVTVGAVGSAGLVIATSVFFGKPFLAALYSPEFARHSANFIALSLASSLQCIAGVAALLLHSMQRFRDVAVGHVAACLDAGVLAPWLVRLHGLRGAALAMALGMLTALVWFVIELKRCWNQAQGQPRRRPQTKRYRSAAPRVQELMAS